MTKQIQLYLYIGIATFMLGIVSYVGYVFLDRAEVKKKVVTQKETIETKKIEIKTTAIAERAKGEITQVDKEKRNEADTSFGVHSYTF